MKDKEFAAKLRELVLHSGVQAVSSATFLEREIKKWADELDPPKREPREWWINKYDGAVSYIHDSLENAEKGVDGSVVERTECIHVREVLPLPRVCRKIDLIFGESYYRTNLKRSRRWYEEYHDECLWDVSAYPTYGPVPPHELEE